MNLTKENAENVIPLLQAVADGKKLQICSNGVWRDLDYADFDAGLDKYRIKPEPRVVYVNEYSGALFAYASEEEAKLCVGIGAVRIAVRYVEDINGK